MTDELARDLEALAARGTAKPIVVTWNSPKTDEPGFEAIVRSGWPLFRSFRNCFAAIRHWEVYQERLRSWRERPAPRARMPASARRAIEGATGVLSPLAGSALLRGFGLPLVPEALAATPAEAARAARTLRFPVALKLASPDFPHKTDAGLVALGLASATEVKRAAEALLRRARRANRKARIDGVLVQRMAGAGVELLVGSHARSDPGPRRHRGPRRHLHGGARRRRRAPRPARPRATRARCWRRCAVRRSCAACAGAPASTCARSSG